MNERKFILITYHLGHPIHVIPWLPQILPYPFDSSAVLSAVEYKVMDISKVIHLIFVCKSKNNIKKLSSIYAMFIFCICQEFNINKSGSFLLLPVHFPIFEWINILIEESLWQSKILVKYKIIHVHHLIAHAFEIVCLWHLIKAHHGYKSSQESWQLDFTHVGNLVLSLTQQILLTDQLRLYSILRYNNDMIYFLYILTFSLKLKFTKLQHFYKWVFQKEK